jgi:adenine phosphoribosyltransferase
MMGTGCACKNGICVVDLKSKLRHVMDYPHKGIDFIDITTVLQDGAALSECIRQMEAKLAYFGEFDLVAGPESRGFIFGTPLAYNTGKGFVPIRKRGKLPYKTISVEYALEYGTDVLEMHCDAIRPGQRVVIVDDLLATGGTTLCNIKLVETLGGIVAGILYFVELSYLNARDKLKDYKVESIVSF